MLEKGCKIKIKENLILGKFYGDNYHYTSKMHEFKGKSVTVESHLNLFGDYLILEDNGGAGWNYRMFEIVNVKEDKFLIIDLETIRCPVCHFDLESKYRHAYENKYCPCCGFGDNGLLGGNNENF